MTAALPTLVGVGETADILGVTKQRVHQLARTQEFPRPVARLKATPVWTREAIEDYGLTRRGGRHCPCCPNHPTNAQAGQT